MEATPEVLYHYCSTAVFHSIVTSHTLRLCSMAHTNDFHEGLGAWDALISYLRDRGVESSKLEPFQAGLQWFFSGFGDGFAICFCEEGNDLGQFRHYAADATGIAIGFSLRKLDIFMQRSNALLGPVNYTKDYDSVFEKHFASICELLMQGANFNLSASKRAGRVEFSDLVDTRLLDPLLRLYQQRYFYKDPAFKLEREWRLLRTFTAVKGMNDDSQIYPTKTSLVKGFPLDLRPLGKFAISHVVIGPKHETSPDEVASFLKSNEFLEVRVEKSKIPLR